MRIESGESHPRTFEEQEIRGSGIGTGFVLSRGSEIGDAGVTDCVVGELRETQDRGRGDGAGAHPHVAVIILHWGAMAVTARCLESLGRISFSGRKTVFLIDNARSFTRSAADGAAGLDIEIHRPQRNLGFAGGCAWGISLALKQGADLILLLNNDVVVDPFFLDHLVTAARERPEAGLLCPQIVSMNDPKRAWYAGGTFSLWSGIPVQASRPRRRKATGDAEEVDYATGCAMLIQPALIERIGNFDARFFAYCEDLDFSLRAIRAGFKVLFVPRALVRHAGAQEPDRKSLSIYYSTRNLLEVMRRYGGWYHWVGFLANFAVRWVGFFAVLACVQRRPAFIRALTSGAVDFVRGELGERTFVANGKKAARARADDEQTRTP
jgi:GT2 family glycosyltransferase